MDYLLYFHIYQDLVVKKEEKALCNLATRIRAAPKEGSREEQRNKKHLLWRSRI